MSLIKFEMKHVFSYRATLAPPEFIGPVPDDIRVTFHALAGEAWAPDGAIIGKMRPGSADWLSFRSDDQGMVDVRATMETNDGELLYVQYNGLLDLGEGGYENLRKGKFPETAKVRAAPRILTASKAFAWVNKCQFVSIGEVNFAKNVVSYDVYALS